MKIEASPKELADFVAELQNRIIKNEIDPREVAKIVEKGIEETFRFFGRDK